jgi:hypothetical protein
LEASATQMAIGYVNGVEVFRDEVNAGLLPKEESVSVSLKQGWNSILIKSTCHWGDTWSTWAALKTLDGQPLKNITGVVINNSGS